MNTLLAAALPMAALGLLLGYLPARQAMLAVAALALGAVIGLALTTIVPWYQGIYGVSLLLCGHVYLPSTRSWTSLTSLAAGVAAGLAASGPAELAMAALALLFALPAGWAIRRGWDVAVKVAASWLVATALLAAALPMVTTPGYVADHRE